MEFICHTIHPFKTYNLVICSIFAELCTVITVILRTLLSPHQQLSQPSAATSLLCVSVDLPILDIL